MIIHTIPYLTPIFIHPRASSMQIHPPRPQPLCTTAKRPHTLIASPQARIASPERKEIDGVDGSGLIRGPYLLVPRDGACQLSSCLLGKFSGTYNITHNIGASF